LFIQRYATARALAYFHNQRALKRIAADRNWACRPAVDGGQDFGHLPARADQHRIFALGPGDRRVPRADHAFFECERLVWRGEHLARLVARDAALVMELPLAIESGTGVGVLRYAEDLAQRRTRLGRSQHRGIDLSAGV